MDPNRNIGLFTKGGLREKKKSFEFGIALDDSKALKNSLFNIVPRSGRKKMYCFHNYDYPNESTFRENSDEQCPSPFNYQVKTRTRSFDYEEESTGI